MCATHEQPAPPRANPHLSTGVHELLGQQVRHGAVVALLPWEVALEQRLHLDARLGRDPSGQGRTQHGGEHGTRVHEATSQVRASVPAVAAQYRNTPPPKNS